MAKNVIHFKNQGLSMPNHLINIFRFNRVFWWVISALLILNLFFFTVFAKSQRSGISELQNIYKIKRKAQLPQKDPNQERFIQAKKDLLFFKEQLPPRTRFTDIASELFETLRRNNLYAGKTVYKPEAVDFQGIWKYTTSFTVSGQYPDLKAFLADIQQSKTLFCIENISFSSLMGEDEFVDMKLTISTYFKNE